jgi:hypothetical protein
MKSEITNAEQQWQQKLDILENNHKEGIDKLINDLTEFTWSSFISIDM